MAQTYKYLDGAYMSATGQAVIGQGTVVRAVLYSAAEGGVSVILYDHASGATNPIARFGVDPGVAGGEAHKSRSFEIGRQYTNGVRAVITGTGNLTLVFD